jgi:hypothetical protein
MKVEAYINCKIGLENANIVSVLLTPGCSAGSLLVALVLGVLINILSVQRNRILRVSQPASVATCKTGNRRTQQVTEAADRKIGITAQKEPAGDNTGVSREGVHLEIHNTCSIIRRCSLQLRSTASTVNIATKTASGRQSNFRSASAG